MLRMLRALTGDIRYEQLINEFEDKEEIGMCELLDKYENMGWERGMEQGMDINLVDNLKSLMKTMNLTLDKAMDALQVPQAKREYYAEKMLL